MKFLICLALLLSVFLSSFSHPIKIIASYQGTPYATGVLAVPEASTSEVLEGCWGVNNGKVEFRHDNSICYDPARSIIEYQWIFDVSGDLNDAYDSYDWGSISENELSPDGKHLRTSIESYKPLYQYMSVGTYTVTLKVFNDNPGGPDTDITTLTITVTESPNIPPVADAAGPYTILQGEDLTLEGFITDLNESCGDIVSSAWDLDMDGNYDDFTDASGTVPWSVIESLGLEENVAHEITLRAIDEKAETIYDNTTLTITIATSTEITSGFSEVVIYPNPVGDMLTIKPDFDISKDFKIRIIDSEGKIITERIESGNRSELRINVSKLSPGIYYVQISSKGFNKRLSFIKI